MQLRDFDVNLLVTMEAVWTTRNVSNAAKTLNLAQSTISAALNRLRLALGDELFNWSGSEMVPTPLAEQIMPDVTKLLNGVRTGADQVARQSRYGRAAAGDRHCGLCRGADRRRIAERSGRLRGSATSRSILSRCGRSSSTAPPAPISIFSSSPPTRCGRAAWNGSRCTKTAMSASARRTTPRCRDMEPDEFLRLCATSAIPRLPRIAFNHEMMLWDDLGKEANLRLTMGNYLIFARIVAASDAVAILPKRLATTLIGEWKLKWVEPRPSDPVDRDLRACGDPIRKRTLRSVWLRDTLIDITSDQHEAAFCCLLSGRRPIRWSIPHRPDNDHNTGLPPARPPHRVPGLLLLPRSARAHRHR
jgi:LysR family nod box-dependent transcriptional activator